MWTINDREVIGKTCNMTGNSWMIFVDLHIHFITWYTDGGLDFGDNFDQTFY